MSFDRAKAMLNAERHVAQGKIRSAISEYRQVVANDPRDFGTLNMLGDLLAKNSEKNEAVKCYTPVAEHYAKQGFAQKAIAIYKKIAKLKPNSPEIAEQLAELYKQRGSVTEARSHYLTLAEHYQSKGQLNEALAIRKQIMLLDPKNTDICLTLANAFLQANQKDEAASAFTEAGNRFEKRGEMESAVTAYTSALGSNPEDASALKGMVRAQQELGRGKDAARTLESMLSSRPHNRELLELLADCYIKSGEAAEAEAAVLRLVEQEPDDHSKFLALGQVYLNDGDLKGASRTLAMASEYLLLGGRAEEYYERVREILEKDPSQPGALRLLARYRSWQRDDSGLREALDELAEVGRAQESVEDERYALSQLTMIAPDESKYADRLRELNDKYGFDENPFDETILQEQFARRPAADISDQDYGFDIVPANAAASPEISNSGQQSGNNGISEVAVADREDGELESFALETFEAATTVTETGSAVESTSDDTLTKEIESLEFYIDNGYVELAEKTLEDLAAEYGIRPEFEVLRQRIDAAATEGDAPVIDTPAAVIAPVESVQKTFDLGELRNEFGLEEIDPIDDSDYDTHYQMAIAYQEMGLMEDSIKEYQEAIALVTPNDGTRRFFQCSILLGHCFMQKGMPKLALKWLQRAMETPGLNDDEKQGLWYELGGAFEADGDTQSAARYFEQVYAENVDFRDVGQRIQNLAVAT